VAAATDGAGNPHELARLVDQRDRLASEHLSLESAITFTRTTVEAARAREAEDALQAKWAEAAEYAVKDFEPLVETGEKQIAQLRACMRELLSADSKLQRLVPLRLSDWDGARLVGNLLSAVRDALHEPRTGESLSTRPTLKALATEHVAHLFRDRPPVPVQIGLGTKMLMGDQPASPPDDMHDPQERGN
jgi:hypothetical protein